MIKRPDILVEAAESAARYAERRLNAGLGLRNGWASYGEGWRLISCGSWASYVDDPHVACYARPGARGIVTVQFSAAPAPTPVMIRVVLHWVDDARILNSLGRIVPMFLDGATWCSGAHVVAHLEPQDQTREIAHRILEQA